MNGENKYQLIEMLNGNICRMSLTDDPRELENMFHYAKIRLNDLYHLKFDEIYESKQ